MKKFKHFLGILLSGALLFALSACGQSAPPQPLKIRSQSRLKTALKSVRQKIPILKQRQMP